MKSAPILTAVIAALTIAASLDLQAATIRTDLDADTKARLELVERMRASRGLRYFNRTSPMPDAVVVQAPTVTLTSNAFSKAPAPARLRPQLPSTAFRRRSWRQLPCRLRRRRCSSRRATSRAWSRARSAPRPPAA